MIIECKTMALSTLARIVIERSADYREMVLKYEFIDRNKALYYLKKLDECITVLEIIRRAKKERGL